CFGPQPVGASAPAVAVTCDQTSRYGDGVLRVAAPLADGVPPLFRAASSANPIGSRCARLRRAKAAAVWCTIPKGKGGGDAPIVAEHARRIGSLPLPDNAGPKLAGRQERACNVASISSPRELTLDSVRAPASSGLTASALRLAIRSPARQLKAVTATGRL